MSRAIDAITIGIKISCVRKLGLYHSPQAPESVQPSAEVFGLRPTMRWRPTCAANVLKHFF
jgi:hypothetical protein